MSSTNPGTAEFPGGVAPWVLLALNPEFNTLLDPAKDSQEEGQSSKPPKRIAVSSICTGQLLLVGYKYRGELLSIQKAKFEGFNAGGLKFDTLTQLKAFRGCCTLKQLEGFYSMGSGVKAEFSRIGLGEPLREAYLYKGSFRVGADEYTLSLEPISNYHD
jgi:hypothetical protein